MKAALKNPGCDGGNIHLGHVRSIVAAFDGSADSKRALKEARRLARRHHARLAVVQVVPPITCQADYGYGPVTRVLDDVEAETATRRHLNRMLRAKGRSARTEIVVRSGNPWEQILKAAEQLHADLIVMGSHPHELPESACSEADSHYTNGSRCATLIVKPEGVDLKPASYEHGHHSAHEEMR
jgi:nucleotide-binding universal stress UspA family protein